MLSRSRDALDDIEPLTAGVPCTRWTSVASHYELLTWLAENPSVRQKG